MLTIHQSSEDTTDEDLEVTIHLLVILYRCKSRIFLQVLQQLPGNKFVWPDTHCKHFFGLSSIVWLSATTSAVIMGCSVDYPILIQN